MIREERRKSLWLWALVILLSSEANMEHISEHLYTSSKIQRHDNFEVYALRILYSSISTYTQNTNTVLINVGNVIKFI